jgi:methylmalonyl-CoA/ethylmalonyl-CoA epimerase
MKLDHIGIAVHKLNKALIWYEALGLVEYSREEVADYNVKISMLKLEDFSLELLEPTGEGPVKKFLEKRGEGVHHIAFAVDDLESELKELKAKEVQLIDETPRSVGSRKIAFLKPKHGVLIELVQR